MKPTPREAAERREMILALLEERPYTTTELGEVLGIASGMHQVLAQLARAGAVTRLRDWRWALPDTPRQPAPRRPSGFPRATEKTKPEAAAINHLSTPLSAPEQARSSVRVIDGQEYESIWDGRSPLGGQASGLGSTLSGHSFHVPTSHRHRA